MIVYIYMHIDICWKQDYPDLMHLCKPWQPEVPIEAIHGSKRKQQKLGTCFVWKRLRKNGGQITFLALLRETNG